MVDAQHCDHSDWEYAVVVEPLPGQTTTSTRFYVNELSIRCAACQTAMQFSLGAAHPDMPWADGTLNSGTVARLRGSMTPPLTTARRVWHSVQTVETARTDAVPDDAAPAEETRTDA